MPLGFSCWRRGQAQRVPAEAGKASPPDDLGNHGEPRRAATNETHERKRGEAAGAQRRRQGAKETAETGENVRTDVAAEVQANGTAERDAAGSGAEPERSRERGGDKGERGTERGGKGGRSGAEQRDEAAARETHHQTAGAQQRKRKRTRKPAAKTTRERKGATRGAKTGHPPRRTTGRSGTGAQSARSRGRSVSPERGSSPEAGKYRQSISSTPSMIKTERQKHAASQFFSSLLD